MPRSPGCTNGASNDIHKIGEDAPGSCLSRSARVPWTEYADQTDAVLQKKELRLWLKRHGAIFPVRKAKQQATLGVGFDAPKTERTVETATSQVLLAIKTVSADEAAPAAKAIAAEGPDVTVSSEKADAAVTGDAETAAVAPEAAGLEAPEETASSQETDVTAHEDDGKAAGLEAPDETARSQETDVKLEATDETISSWEATVAEKEDIDQAGTAQETDKGQQTAQTDRQRVYLTQAIVRSVSLRPVIVSSLVCVNAGIVSISLRRHASAGICACSSLHSCCSSQFWTASHRYTIAAVCQKAFLYYQRAQRKQLSSKSSGLGAAPQTCSVPVARQDLLLQSNRMTHIKEDLLRHHWTPESLQMLKEEQDKRQNLMHELQALDTSTPANDLVQDLPDKFVNPCSDMLCFWLIQRGVDFVHHQRKKRNTAIKIMQAVQSYTLIRDPCPKHGGEHVSQAQPSIKYCMQL